VGSWSLTFGAACQCAVPCQTEVAGLTLAFLDGMFDEKEYSADKLDTDTATCRYFREVEATGIYIGPGASCCTRHASRYSERLLG
jgi:hypothetical protein